MTFRKTFLPALILAAICLFCAAALALTNLFTEEKIQAVQKENLLRSARAVLTDAASLETLENFDGEGFVGKKEDGTVFGYAFKTVAKGYGGEVVCVVGFDLNGTVLGVSVSAPNETPGLGNNVEKNDFALQFTGMTEPPLLKQDGGTVDGVTGASYSSRAVTVAVGEAFSLFETVRKGA